MCFASRNDVYVPQAPFLFSFLYSLLNSIFPLVAQLDNAADSDSEERGFESLQAGQETEYQPLWLVLCLYNENLRADNSQVLLQFCNLT